MRNVLHINVTYFSMLLCSVYLIKAPCVRLDRSVVSIEHITSVHYMVSKETRFVIHASLCCTAKTYISKLKMTWFQYILLHFQSLYFAKWKGDNRIRLMPLFGSNHILCQTHTAKINVQLKWKGNYSQIKVSHWLSLVYFSCFKKSRKSWNVNVLDLIPSWISKMA